MTTPEEFDDWLDLLRAEMQRMEVELRELGWGPDWRPTGDIERDNLIHALGWSIAYFNRMLDALEAGDFLGAIIAAQESGYHQGRTRPSPTLGAIRSLANFLEPHAEARLKTRERQAAAGKATRILPSDEELERVVIELHERRPNLSWKRVCELVAQQYGVKDWRAVARKLQGGPADWRKRSL